MRIVAATADKILLNRLTAGLGEYDGIEVTGAPDGAAALRCIAETLPDCVLTDVVMPRADGLALIDALPKLALERTPFVFVMLLPQQEKIGDLAMSKGASGVFGKPIDTCAVAERLLAANSDVREVSRDSRFLISLSLNEIGVPRHLIGYTFLHEAIGMAVADRSVISKLTTAVYPFIAEKHGSTKIRVERSMRFAIESAWNRARVNKIEEMFGYTVRSDVGRPANGEFIAMTAEHVRVLAAKR